MLPMKTISIIRKLNLLDSLRNDPQSSSDVTISNGDRIYDIEVIINMVGIGNMGVLLFKIRECSSD